MHARLEGRVTKIQRWSQRKARRPRMDPRHHACSDRLKAIVRPFRAVRAAACRSPRCRDQRGWRRTGRSGRNLPRGAPAGRHRPCRAHTSRIGTRRSRPTGKSAARARAATSAGHARSATRRSHVIGIDGAVRYFLRQSSNDRVIQGYPTLPQLRHCPRRLRPADRTSQPTGRCARARNPRSRSRGAR